jgi:parallel beta-helix repeat protein
MFAAILPLLLALPSPNTVEVVRDDTVIRESCTVTPGPGVVADLDDDGAVQIVGDGLVVDFGGATLRGAEATLPRNLLVGVGVHVRGKNVTVRNLKLDGYKVGILADGCDGLTLENVEILRGYGMRLGSTPSAEDSADWLSPHQNDDDQWRTQHGAAIAVENSAGVTISKVKVRESQNGIVLSRVVDSRIYDNDASFLSGWGLALWRSSRNLISRNAFDFCVRGYSHNVYNRGQDSAGILLFEQCERNVVVENSATHCGDGVFAFAGREALGEVGPPPGADDAFHAGRGCNANIFAHNDFSYAAAHGLELTFSFDNVIVSNRFTGNAICGIWGGYSRRTLIAANRFADNGGGAYGGERGGVNIEHGVGNRIEANVFQRNRCGVRLWWDEDAGIAALPWAAANGPGSTDNLVLANMFDGDEVGIELRAAQATTIAENRFANVKVDLEIDEASTLTLKRERPKSLPALVAPNLVPMGESRPVGARTALAGRDKIIVTEWGPYDWASPQLQLVERRINEDLWAVLGPAKILQVSLDGRGPLRHEADLSKGTLRIWAEEPGFVLPYLLRVRLDDGTAPSAAAGAGRENAGRQYIGEGVLLAGQWSVTMFQWTVDPRVDHDAWRNEVRSGATFLAPKIDFPFRVGGPREIAATVTKVPADTTVGAVTEKLLAMRPDKFGVIATTTVAFPPGRWAIVSSSDDGIRVWVNDKLVIDHWTWHAPTIDRGVVEFAQPMPEATIRVEHFELDGVADLRLWVERVDGESAAK